jgi:hypothetical protein
LFKVTSVIAQSRLLQQFCPGPWESEAHGQVDYFVEAFPDYLLTSRLNASYMIYVYFSVFQNILHPSLDMMRFIQKDQLVEVELADLEDE